MTQHEYERWLKEVTEPDPVPKQIALIFAALLCAAAWLLMLAGAW